MSFRAMPRAKDRLRERRRQFWFELAGVVLICCATAGIVAFKSFDVRQAPAPAWITEAKYDRQFDGDTAVFEVTHKLRIRFADCWCGETDSKDPVEKKLGKEADAFLRALVADHPGKWTIEIPTSKMRDGDLAHINTMGRWVGLVYLPEPDGRCVNDLLVEAGLAGRTKAELKELIEKRRKQ